MQSEEIRQALKAKGLNFSIVAAALEVTPQHVSRVASRRALSHRVAAGLAKALNLPIKDVFPDVKEYRVAPPSLPRKARIEALKKELGRPR